MHQHAHFPAAVGQPHEQASRDRFDVTPVIAYHDRTLGLHVSAVDSSGQRLKVVNTEDTQCLWIWPDCLWHTVFSSCWTGLVLGLWAY
jgi:hypothetical protein